MARQTACGYIDNPKWVEEQRQSKGQKFNRHAAGAAAAPSRRAEHFAVLVCRKPRGGFVTELQQSLFQAELSKLLHLEGRKTMQSKQTSNQRSKRYSHHKDNKSRHQKLDEGKRKQQIWQGIDVDDDTDYDSDGDTDVDVDVDVAGYNSGSVRVGCLRVMFTRVASCFCFGKSKRPSLVNGR
jgi:hypothetical protein